MTRKRKSCGHCRKSFARDGEPGPRGRPDLGGRLDGDLDRLLHRVVAGGGRREVGGVLVEVLHCHAPSVGGAADTTDHRPTYS